MNFQQILPTDNFSELANKINENFLVVIQNGGGPRGPKGDVGDIGPIGPVGERGTRWWYGIVDPNSLIFDEALEGDFYLQSDGKVWILDTQWNDTGISIKGPKGDPSDSGFSDAGICITSGSAPVDGKDFKYISPSGEYYCLSSRPYQSVVFGGSPNGTSLCSNDIGNISCNYWKDINITQSTILVHTPQASGSRHITLSRPEGTGIGSSQNTSNISEMSYLNVNTYDALLIKAPRRIDSSLRSCNSDGIILSTDDSDINLSSARDIKITATGLPLSNKSCTGNSIASTGNITISSSEGTCGGYSGSSIKIFKGSGSDLGRGGIRIGNGCTNNGDIRIFSFNDVCTIAGGSNIIEGTNVNVRSGFDVCIDAPGIFRVDGEDTIINAGNNINLTANASFTLESNDIQIESKSSNIILRTPAGSSRHIFTSTCNAQNAGLTVEFENSGESRIHIQSACSCISTIRLGGLGRNVSSLNRTDLVYDRSSSIFTVKVYDGLEESIKDILQVSPSNFTVCANTANLNGVVTIPSAVLCFPAACSLNVGSMTVRCASTFCSTVNLNSNVCTNSTGSIDINKPVTFSNNVTFCAFSGSLRFLGCTYFGQAATVSICGTGSRLEISNSSCVVVCNDSTIGTGIRTRTLTLSDGPTGTFNPNQSSAWRIIRCNDAFPIISIQGIGSYDGQHLYILPERNSSGCWPNICIGVAGVASLIPNNFSLTCQPRKLIYSACSCTWFLLD